MNAEAPPARRGDLGGAVRERLLSRIQSGSLRPGERLPPEPELAARFGVSRATLREALRGLADDGWITRTRGAGTYVTHRPRLHNNLDDNFGVSELIRSMGMRPGTENLRVYDAVASSAECERLGIPPNSSVCVVERIRTANDEAVVYSRDIVPAALLGNDRPILDRLGQGALYEMLERDFGIVIVQGIASIRPVKADRWLAGQLRVKTGRLLLHLVQVDYDEAGRAVLLAHEYHLADAFDVTVVRRGPGRRT
jgi:GntR family transcriptional regulator